METSYSMAGLISLGGESTAEGLSDYDDVRREEVYEMAEAVERHTKNAQTNCDAATRATQDLNRAYTEVGTTDKRARFDARLGDSDDDEVCKSHISPC